MGVKKLHVRKQDSSSRKHAMSSTTAAAAPAGASEAPAAAPGSSNSPEDPIVQYIVLRRDLWADQGWPLGPLIAQACHASVAALWLNREDKEAQAYVAEDTLDHMHKVVLEVKGETQLKNLSKKLQDENILHKVWVEQPEAYPTALATKPYTKSQIAHLFKKLKLCKAQLS